MSVVDERNTAGIQSRSSHFENTRDEIRRRKRTTAVIGSILFILVFVGSAKIGRLNILNLKDLPRVFNYVEDTIPQLRLRHLGHDLGRWYSRGDIWVSNVFDTILIAFLSTLISVACAFLLCFPASRNIMKNTVLYFIARRILDIARAVPELVYAMIFVFAFNLGPLPGVLAIAVHSTGSLGKLFSEVNENISMEPIEGIKSTGGNWFQVVRYAVVPQVLPNFMSYALLRFELNIRAATVIGLVGAGGIGMELMTAIRQFQYTDVSAISLMIIVLVVAIDWGCEKLRHRVIGEQELL